MEMIKSKTDVFIGEQIMYTPHYIQEGVGDGRTAVSVSPVKPSSTIEGRKTPF